MKIDLKDKVAIVTGGDGGIGQGIVAVLAGSGASVFTACRNLENAKQVITEYYEAGLEVLPIEVDVTNQESVDKMVEEVIKKMGRIDILVNNAGVVGFPGWENREAENDDDWEVNYQVNLRGLSRVTDAVIGFMKKNKYGKIINVSSIAGRGGNKSHIPSSYGATKAGVINLTQTIALALAPYNINVNAVCPGIVWTPMWKAVATKLSLKGDNEKKMSLKGVFDNQVTDRVPFGRAQTAEDIGYLVAFLASEFAKNITGQSININGGMRMN